MRKGGLSAVVTTLLIIMISFVAIAVVWVVIRNLVDDATSGISFDSFTLDLGIGNAYIDGNDVKVSVRRSAGSGELSGIYFIFHNGTSSTSVKRSTSLNELEETTFTFNSSEVGNLSNVNLVSISPISSSSGAETILGITDTAEISPTPPGSSSNPGSGSGSGSGPGGGGPICGNAICESGEDAVSCSVDCATPSSCDDVWQGNLEDSGVECDGGAGCLITCSCPMGYLGDGAGGCVSEPSLNMGFVGSVWPNGVGKYFDSNDLPKNATEVISYNAKYVNFTGAETRCMKITYAEYLSDPVYNKSYLRLELPSAISTGDFYQIWWTNLCGATPP